MQYETLFTVSDVKCLIYSVETEVGGGEQASHQQSTSHQIFFSLLHHTGYKKKVPASNQSK